MTVTNENFLDWANFVDVTRLPLAEGEIDALQSQQALDTAEITQQGQTFNDWLSQHDVTIQVAQDSADTANTKADNALIGLTNLDLNLQAYIDAQIAALHSQLTSEYTTAVQNSQNIVQGNVDTQIGALSPSLIGELDARIDVVNAQMNQRMIEISEVDSAVDAVTNTLFPIVDARTQATEAQANAIQAEIDALTFEFGYDNLVQKFDLLDDSIADAGFTIAGVRYQAEQQTALLFPHRCTAPATAWSNGTAASAPAPALRTAIDEADLITDDATLGECIQLDVGANMTLGHAAPVPFEAGRVYKVSVTLRCYDDGISALGAHTRLGATTFASGVVANDNTQEDSGIVTVADGIYRVAVYFSTDQAKLDEISDIYGAGTKTQVLSPSALADMAYFFVRQNHNGSGTDGGLRIQTFAVQDVTDAQDVARLVRTELTSAIDGVSANLTTNYMTAVNTTAAISAATLDLRSKFSGNALVPDFYAEDLYWTSVVDQPPDADNTFTSEISFATEIGIGKFLRIDASPASILRVASRARLIYRPGAVIRLKVKARLAGTLGTGTPLYLTLRGQSSTYGYLTVTSNAKTFAAANAWEEFTFEVTVPSGGSWTNVAFLQAQLYKPSTYVNPGTTLDVAYFEVDDLSDLSATNANLSNNYYTKAAADSATAAQITSFQSQLEGPTGSVGLIQADLTNNYYTQVGTDAAIAAELQNFEATWGAGIEADITSIKNLTVTNASAFGVLMDELNVSAGGIVAGISNFGTVMADMYDNAQAAYVFRAKAGGSSADFEMVAWDDSTGGGSVIKLNAEYILLEGSVAAKQLAVGDFTNLANGCDMEDEARLPFPLKTGMALSTSTYYSGSKSLSLQPSFASSSYFQNELVVTPGEELYIEARIRADSSYNGDGNYKIRIGRGSDNGILSAIAFNTVPTRDAWHLMSTTVVVPAGENRLTVSIYKGSSFTTGWVWIDDIVIRKKSKGELLVDGAITGNHVNANSVATKLAEATTAYIGNAHIAERLTTDSIAVGGGGNLLDNSTWAAGTKNVFQTASDDASMAAQCSYRIRPYTTVTGWAPRNGCLELYQNGVAGSSESRYWEIRLGVINSETDSTANKAISVEPSAWYEFQAHISTHRCTGNMYVFWYDTSWNNVGTPGVTIPHGTGASNNPDGWPFYSMIVQAPATAYYAVIVFRKRRTLTGEANSYMFVHKPMLAKTHAGASEVSEYKPSGMTYITKDQVLTKTLTANEIQLDELTLSSDGNGKLLIKANGVDTGHVADNSISITRIAGGTGNQSITWTADADCEIAVMAFFDLYVEGATAKTGYARIYRDSTLLATAPISKNDTSPTTTSEQKYVTLVTRTTRTAGQSVTIHAKLEGDAITTGKTVSLLVIERFK